jgi:hypothetical protein
MKKISLIGIVIMIYFVSVTAQAGEWVLWELESITGKDVPEIKKTNPLDEFKTLKKCQKAAAKIADHTYSWAKKNETINTETVSRMKNPDGVLYSYTTNYFVQAEYRCYPFGVVPTKPRE